MWSKSNIPLYLLQSLTYFGICGFGYTNWLNDSFIHLLFDKCYLAPTIYQGLFLGSGKQWTRQRETQLSWSLYTNVIQAAYTVCTKVKKIC